MDENKIENDQNLNTADFNNIELMVKGLTDSWKAGGLPTDDAFFQVALLLEQFAKVIGAISIHDSRSRSQKVVRGMGDVVFSMTHISRLMGGRLLDGINCATIDNSLKRVGENTKSDCDLINGYGYHESLPGIDSSDEIKGFCDGLYFIDETVLEAITMMLQSTALLLRKSKDYNYKTPMQKYYPNGDMMAIVNIKFQRILSLLKQEVDGVKNNFEAKEDSMIDLANYLFIWAALSKSKTTGGE